MRIRKFERETEFEGISKTCQEEMSQDKNITELRSELWDSFASNYRVCTLVERWRLGGYAHVSACTCAFTIIMIFKYL